MYDFLCWLRRWYKDFRYIMYVSIYDRTAFEERNYYRVWSLMLMIRSARSNYKGARFNPIEIVFPFVFCVTG